MYNGVYNMSKSEVGNRHRQAREELGLAVPDYAAAMNVRPSTVYSWESGRTAVPQNVLAALEQRYGVSASWILTGDTSAPKHESGMLHSLQQQLVHLQGLVSELRRESPTVLSGGSTGRTRIPLLALGVSAGTPTVSDDVIEREIDLAEMLLEHPDSTYFIRVVGDSMLDAGIADGDTLIVDCAIAAKPGQVVIARVFGELTVKRYLNQGNQPLLRAENRKYRDITITPDMDFGIVGVVRSCIKQF